MYIHELGHCEPPFRRLFTRYPLGRKERICGGFPDLWNRPDGSGYENAGAVSAS
jgi:hypothetical protein